ncbi:ATP-binding protein, partial [Burkholderia sp. 9777_1386]|nr:ATP-binding protein [Burkholderia sp. 9777_1386]
EWWSLCTWYDVRDMLHDRGYQAEAQQAHYQAVPELTDMIGLLSTEAIRTTFGTVQRDGSQELLLSYIQRSLTSARSEYRMLAGRTRFALNPDTSLIAVDLNLVAGDATPAGRLKTGIMYLFAGQITSGDFILPQYQ